jgi:plasmid stabilization system protein ParE
LKSLLLRPAAAADLEEAWLWYEKQRTGLGNEFLEEAEAAIRRVLDTPLAFGVVYKDRRRALLRRFPYGVVYRILEDQVVVLAVVHARRRPRVWRQRL